MHYDSGFDAIASPASFSPARPAFRCEALIAYDEAANARHAVRLIHGLVRQIGGDVARHPDLYRFDILPLPDVSPTALEAGLRADLLIVAAAGERNLPKPVQSWLSTWALHCPAGGPALVGLLPQIRPGAGNPSPVRNFLGDLATRARIAFFTRDFTVSPGPAPVTNSRLDHHARPSNPMRRGIPRHCRPASPEYRDETLFPVREP